MTWHDVAGEKYQDVYQGAVMPGKSIILFGYSGIVMRADPPYSTMTSLPFVINQIQPVRTACAVTDRELICVDDYGVAMRYEIGDTLMRPVLGSFAHRCADGGYDRGSDPVAGQWKVVDADTK
jgi:hypothetical protein